MRVATATADGWEQLRDVRVAAMTTNPEAFGSRLERALATTANEWRSMAERRAVALDGDGAAVGMVGWHRDEDDPPRWQLIGTWVAPSARGRGVGAALVAHVLAKAGSVGVATTARLPAESLVRRC